MVDEAVGGELAVPTPEEVTPASVDVQKREAVLARYRKRFSDLSDELWDQVLERIRGGESLRSVQKTILELGLCAHLSPGSIWTYLSRIREVLPEAVVSEEDDDDRLPDDVPIETADALKKLRWCIRLQQARVKKAMQVASMMAGMLFPKRARNSRPWWSSSTRRCGLSSRPGR